MKVLVGDTEVLARRHDSFDDLVATYVQDETTAGRTIPSYALETLLAALAGWFLKKAADEVWSWYWQHKRDQASLPAKQLQDERDTRRHREIVEALGRLEEVSKAGPIVIVLETPAEHDLAEALQQELLDSSVKVVRQLPS